MDTVDLLITGGEVITHNRRKYANVVVQDGKIVGVLDAHTSLPKAQKIIDATGLYVLPGAVDPHTHIGGATKVVGNLAAAMKLCTRALAIGGTTTVMEMIPPTKGLSLRAGLAEARAERRGNMAIDFAFHPSIASVDDQVIAGLEECAEDGTPSFHGSFEGARGREPLDEGGLYRLLNLAHSRKMMAIIHAEDARLNRKSSARPTTPVRWKMSRVAARGFQRPQRYNAPSLLGRSLAGRFISSISAPGLPSTP